MCILFVIIKNVRFKEIKIHTSTADGVFIIIIIILEDTWKLL